MTSQHDKPFILSQDTFLASQTFPLPQIPVIITIQLHKIPDQANNVYGVSVSHYIKTQELSAPAVNQLNQTIVCCAADNKSARDNNKAFDMIIDSFFDVYEEAKKGGLMPSKSWLVPNREFVEFNNTKVQ